MPFTHLDKYEHPLFDPISLSFNTPAVTQLKEDVHRWLWTGATGAIITGASRAGKTTALKNILDQLYTRDKVKVPTYYVSIPKRDQPNITSIFRLLCLSMNLRVTNHDRADHLSKRFIEHLADEAILTNCMQAVLIVDEMQRLKARQFEAFAEIHDDLLFKHIRLMVIFVGNNSESSQLIEQIQQPNYAHIFGRFFNHITTFSGLTSKQEVEKCLLKYDTLRYPDNGPTYTEFFLPKAVKAGWQLRSLSRDIWRVYYEYKRNFKIPSWGMYYFITAVNTLLIDMLDETNVDEVDDAMIHECIRLSGLISSIVKPV